MYRNIMVPTDGSGFDREAIRVALRLAERSDAKIRLVRVLSQGSFFGMAAAAEGTSIAADVVRSERDRALSELYALAAECRATTNADIGVDLHAGPVTDVLEGYAKRHEFDLIVMSTHGRTGISRLAWGSVTESLIRHTGIPVLVVKPPSSYLNPRVTEMFRRILVPLDGSALAEQALPRAVELAKLEGAEIILLRVLTPQAYPPRAIEAYHPSWLDRQVSHAEHYLFDVAERIRTHNIPTMTDIVISEDVSAAIVDFAERQRAEVIAIATHGRGGAARVLYGSVAEAVIRSANACVLVRRPELAEVRSAPITAVQQAQPA